MAHRISKSGFTSGTGNQDLDLVLTGVTKIELEHGSSTTKHSHGTVVIGGNQYCYVNDNSDSVAKALEIQDNSGTVVFSCVYVSNPSGSNYRFSKTVNTLGTVNVTFTTTNT